MKLIQDNKYARFEYYVENTYEAGISLDGGEVKSVRAGNVNLKDSFCLIANGEVFYVFPNRNEVLKRKGLYARSA